MKTETALVWGVNRLRALDNPRLEAEVLLMHASKWDRMRLYNNLQTSVGWWPLMKYRLMTEKRRRHMPSAYLIRKKEFCGLEFTVDPNVLIPRPETESLVYRAIGLVKQHRYQVVHDIGTGCGNIAISLAKLCPDIKVVASDINPKALAAASINAAHQGVIERVSLVQGSLASHIRQAGLVIANLPYVPRFYEVSWEVRREPALAIFDPAEDGLGLYRELFNEPLFGHFNGQVLIELRPEQYQMMADWVQQRHPHVKAAPIRNIDGQIWGLEADFSGYGGGSVELHL